MIHTVGLVEVIRRHQEFCLRAFGPIRRIDGLLDHLRKELVEVEAKPNDVLEWIDVVLLALDGARQVGCSPELIAAALTAKIAINEQRKWPDWHNADPSKAIEHERPEQPDEPDEPIEKA